MNPVPTTAALNRLMTRTPRRGQGAPARRAHRRPRHCRSRQAEHQEDGARHISPAAGVGSVVATDPGRFGCPGIATALRPNKPLREVGERETKGGNVNIRPPLCAFGSGPLTALSASSLQPLLTYRPHCGPGRLVGVDTLDTSISVTPCARPDCRRALTEARAQAGFYKAMFRGVKQREVKLQEQLAQAKADAAER